MGTGGWPEGVFSNGLVKRVEWLQSCFGRAYVTTILFAPSATRWTTGPSAPADGAMFHAFFAVRRKFTAKRELLMTERNLSQLSGGGSLPLDHSN